MLPETAQAQVPSATDWTPILGHSLKHENKMIISQHIVVEIPKHDEVFFNRVSGLAKQ